MPPPERKSSDSVLSSVGDQPADEASEMDVDDEDVEDEMKQNGTAEQRLNIGSSEILQEPTQSVRNSEGPVIQIPSRLSSELSGELSGSKRNRETTDDDLEDKLGKDSLNRPASRLDALPPTESEDVPSPAPTDSLNEEEEISRISKEILSLTPKGARAVVRQNWRHCIVSKDSGDDAKSDESFMFRALFKSVNKDYLMKRAMDDQGVAMIRNAGTKTLAAIMATHGQKLIAVATDETLDAALRIRLQTIDAKSLVKMLAGAKRLGYEEEDIVNDDDENIGTMPVEHARQIQYHGQVPIPMVVTGAQASRYYPPPVPSNVPSNIAPPVQSTLGTPAPGIGGIPQGMGQPPPHQQYYPPGPPPSQHQQVQPQASFQPQQYLPPPPPSAAQHGNGANGVILTTRGKEPNFVPGSKHVCTNCGGSFTQSAGLKYHQANRVCFKKSVATDPVTRYTCPECNKQFATTGGLQYHTENKVCRVNGVPPNAMPGAVNGPPPSFVAPDPPGKALATPTVPSNHLTPGGYPHSSLPFAPPSSGLPPGAPGVAPGQYVSGHDPRTGPVKQPGPPALPAATSTSSSLPPPAYYGPPINPSQYPAYGPGQLHHPPYPSLPPNFAPPPGQYHPPSSSIPPSQIAPPSGFKNSTVNPTPPKQTFPRIVSFPETHTPQRTPELSPQAVAEMRLKLEKLEERYNRKMAEIPSSLTAVQREEEVQKIKRGHATRKSMCRKAYGIQVRRSKYKPANANMATDGGLDFDIAQEPGSTPASGGSSFAAINKFRAPPPQKPVHSGIERSQSSVVSDRGLSRPGSPLENESPKRQRIDDDDGDSDSSSNSLQFLGEKASAKANINPIPSDSSRLVLPSRGQSTGPNMTPAEPSTRQSSESSTHSKSKLPLASVQNVWEISGHATRGSRPTSSEPHVDTPNSQNASSRPSSGNVVNGGSTAASVTVATDAENTATRGYRSIYGEIPEGDAANSRPTTASSSKAADKNEGQQEKKSPERELDQEAEAKEEAEAEEEAPHNEDQNDSSLSDSDSSASDPTSSIPAIRTTRQTTSAAAAAAGLASPMARSAVGLNTRAASASQGSQSPERRRVVAGR